MEKRGRGAPKGHPQWGGRKTGTKNKRTVEKELMAEKGLKLAKETGVSPLEVMLNRMRDPEAVTTESFEAAVAAAPYVHPRLASATVTHKDVLSDLTDEQLASLLAFAEGHVGVAFGATIEGRDKTSDCGKPDQDIPAIH